MDEDGYDQQHEDIKALQNPSGTGTGRPGGIVSRDHDHELHRRYLHEVYEDDDDQHCGSENDEQHDKYK